MIGFLEMEPLRGVNVICGDFLESSTLALIEQQLGDRPIDLVVSDMAPNISGVNLVDQARSIHLAELAFEFARLRLKPGGDLLVKVFQGSGLDEFRKLLSSIFRSVAVRKPKASRDRSSEFYLLARGKTAHWQGSGAGMGLE